MKHYIGIDLGTTNSAICSYDGEKVRVWKSPEQADVTPSAIHVDKRGRKRYGMRAYEQLAISPDNVAALFKRFMGSNTKILIKNADNDGSPEAWSSELLKVLYGYLPEEIRLDESAGIVITVPAAFNEMQKDATMHAANMAQLGNVALMQEPVAAIMAVMRHRQSDGTFLIYDLGGGTLDIAIAQSLGGKVQLLAHGGIQVCGGRDIDRLIVENTILPFLEDNFSLPEDYEHNSEFSKLMRIAPYVAEMAKIELSVKNNAMISSPASLDLEDENGEEIFFEIPISREDLDYIIADKIDETIAAARETIAQAGMQPDEIDQIIFIGGPTNYKPLRDKVSGDLGIEANTEVNPMTAVAEGAAVFCEAIDWSTKNRLRKKQRNELKGKGINFYYNSRTPDNKTKIVAQVEDKNIKDAEFEVSSLDSGWNSGRMMLRHGSSVEVVLPKSGPNRFKVVVYDAAGNPVQDENWEIVITRAAAAIDAIPASHSIGIEVQGPRDSRKLDYLIRAGDPLPHKGKATYKAATEIRSGQLAFIKIRMWEGEIEHPIEDNRFIGCLNISGMDFDIGIIREGDDIICDYEILDSGVIKMSVSLPSVGAILDANKNFYCRQDAQIDYAVASERLQEETERVLQRIDELNKKIADPKLDMAKEKLESYSYLLDEAPDIEKAKEAEETVQQAKKLIYKTRLEHLSEIRQLELDNLLNFYNNLVREYARPQQASQFDNLARTAKRSLEQQDDNFEYYLSEMKYQTYGVLWRQDWYIENIFKIFETRRSFFDDKENYSNLMSLGNEAIAKKNWNLLRTIIGQLYEAQNGWISMEDDAHNVNIYKS